jgi:flagellar protein FlbD
LIWLTVFGEAFVIAVTRLDGSEFYLNADLIESIESTPDTVLVLSNHKRLIVREPPVDLINSIVAYRRRIFAVGPRLVED